MKLIIASDIHGSLYYTQKLLDRFVGEKGDKLIILGDFYYHGPRNPLTEDYNPADVAKALNGYKHCLIAIKGNCDADVDQMISEFEMKERVDLEYNGKIITLTHGHRYNLDNVPFDCGDIMLYGYFHVPFIKEENGVIFASPGSVSLPKLNTKHSYMVIDDGEIIIKSLEGEILQKLCI